MQNKWDMTYWGLPFPLAAFNMGVHDYHLHVVSAPPFFWVLL